jgi:hypothetical protein
MSVQLSRFGLILWVAMTMTAAGAAMAAAANPLAALRWRDRVLLVFAPSESDPDLSRQRQDLARDPDALRERDLVRIEVVGGKAQGAPMALDADALRDAYGVRADAFAVILIGKDGGEKLRGTHPLTAARLFGVIDAMPMRRQEASHPPTHE